MANREFAWIEFKVKPKKEGLHDSGYRFISLIGVSFDENKERIETPLHQWSDHVALYGPTNIDVEADGTIRFMNWSGNAGKWVTSDGPEFFPSSACFYPSNPESAASLIKIVCEVHFEVTGR